jgi:hypothetical protein
VVFISLESFKHQVSNAIDRVRATRVSQRSAKPAFRRSGHFVAASGRCTKGSGSTAYAKRLKPLTLDWQPGRTAFPSCLIGSARSAILPLLNKGVHRYARQTMSIFAES